MKPRTKFFILLIFAFTMIILVSCTPTPNCSATYNVTKTTDTNDGVCSPGDCSLREAVPMPMPARAHTQLTCRLAVIH